jgi:RHS repeat-associated protein
LETATVGATYTYSALANDLTPGDRLSYQLLEAPAGMQIGQDSGQIIWIPIESQTGKHDIAIEVVDSVGLRDQQNFVITVEAASCSVDDLPSASYPHFENLTNWQLNGSAFQLTPNEHNVLRLTRDLTQSGSAFLKDAITLSNGQGGDTSFSANFGFRLTHPIGISDQDGQGADGLVFVIQSMHSTVGGIGGSIGYGDIQRSLGIEFDTWNNGAVDDNNGNHVGINLNGDMESIQLHPVNERFNDGDQWFAWVDYDGQSKQLELRLERQNLRPEDALLVQQGIDLATILESEAAYVGFTSGTGDGGGRHDVFEFEFTGNSNQENDCTELAIVSTPPLEVITGQQLVYVIEIDGVDANTHLSFSLDTGPVDAAIDANGVLTWLAAAPGTAEFILRVETDQGESVLQSFSVDILPAPNQAPLANNLNVTSIEDASITVVLQASDAEGDALSYVIVDQPVNGVLSGNAPNLVYQPNIHFNGLDNFSYRANDGQLDSNIASVSITVTAVNDAPEANDQSIGTAEDQELVIVLSGSDVDGDALDFKVTTQPANGVLSGSGANLTYTPNLNFNGADQFTFVCNDGQVDSVPALISIQVDAVNDAPQVTSDPVLTGEEKQIYLYQILAIDSDGDTLDYNLLAAPTGMTVSTEGLVSWTPQQGDAGPHSVSVRVFDDNGGADIQTFLLMIDAAPNLAPVITSAAETLAFIEQDYRYAIVANDADEDPLTFIADDMPSGMALDADTGELIWQPGQLDIGAHLVSIRVEDPSGASARQEFTLIVGATDAGKAAYMGTEFWIPLYSLVENTQLVISSEVDTSGVIDVPDGQSGEMIPFSTQAGQITLVNLEPPTFAGSGQESNARSGLRGWSAYITADEPISIRVIYYQRAESDAMLALPVRALGTEYITSNMGGSQNGLYPRSVLIADQDDTQVTILASKQLEIDGNTVLPGEQYTLTLNRGDDFHLKPLPHSHDFSGTIISSNKPIAVYAGHDCADVPADAIYCNMLVEQLPPTSLWQKEFLTTPLRTRYGEIFRVMAAVDNTTVNVNGVLQGIINRGEYLDFPLLEASVISADQPIQAIQHATGLSYDDYLRKLDPYYDLLAQAQDQTTSWSTSHFVELDPAPAPNWVFILMPFGNIADLQLDGLPIDAEVFGPVISWSLGSSGPNPGAYSGAQIALNPGGHVFSAPVPFGLFKNTEALYEYADPGMANLPAVDNYQKAYSFQTPGGSQFARHFINVTVPNSVINEVLLDGRAIDPGQFFPLANTNYSYARVGVNLGSHYISSPEPFGLMVYGFGDDDNYMYAGGWAFNQTQVTTSLNLTPDSLTPLVNAQLCLNITVRDSADEPVSFARIALDIDGVNADELTVTANQDGFAQHCYLGKITGTDQVTATVDAVQQSLQIDWIEAAGNDAPAITSQPVTLTQDGELYQYPVSAFDADGNNLIYALLDGPAGMAIDPLSGEISWTAVSGSFPVSIQVSDTNGASDQQDYLLLVNRAPALDQLPLTAMFSNYIYNSRITAIDADGDTLFYNIVEEDQPNFEIDSNSGEIVSRAVLPVGFYPITISVSDRKGGVIYHNYTLEVSGINSAPVLTAAQSSITAFGGDVITFNVDAVDANNDAVVVTVSESDVPLLQVDGSSGQGTWSPINESFGTSQATLVAIDEWGAQSAPLVIDFELFENQIHQIVSIPPGEVRVGSEYVYPIVVNDPEDGPIDIRISWLDLANGMYIDDDDVLRWTPPSDYYIRDFHIQISAADNLGREVVQEVNFTVKRANPTAPELDSGVPGSAIVGYPLSYQLAASDADGDPIDFSLINGPDGMTVSSDGLINWTPDSDQAGLQPVSVRISDGDKAVDIDWQIDTLLTPPPLVANILVEPQFIPIGDSADLTIEFGGGIDPSIDSVLLNGSPITLVNNQATLTPNTVGRHDIVVNLLDNGVITRFESFVSVTDPSDVEPPQLSIQSPTEAATITTLADVIGTVQDANLIDVYLYAHRVDSSDHIDLYRGEDAFASELIGVFDPTLLRNGQYRIVLQATDANNLSAAVQTTVVVEGGMKIGNFSMTFEDLNIPMAGIPIRVTRTYDSRRKHENLDFGYGWSIDYQNISVEESSDPAVGWIYSQEYHQFTINSVPTTFSVACMRSTTNKTVTVTLPNDDVEEFTIGLDGMQGSLKADHDPDCDLTASTTFDLRFDAKEGTTSKLEAYANHNMTLSNIGEGILIDDITDSTPSNVAKYRLTTKAGFVYNLDQDFGIESASDPNGNTLTYSDTGISHSSGKSIAFNRDIDGRIDSITDPSGQVIEYDYSATGDLVAMTDREFATSTYEYDETHGLTDLYDALGRRVLKNLYDDDGRLLAQEDSDGNRTEFLHDIGSHSSQVTDRLGHITQFGYDERGNVISEVDALGNLTTYTYDANDNQLSRTDALGNTSSATWDGQDNQLTQTDELGRVTSFTYNEFGKEVEITDPKGNTYTNGYDAVGNLISISDPDNNLLGVLWLNSDGLVSRLADTYDNFTEYSYDGDGNKLTETDALGNVTAFTYDDNGNVLTETVQRTVDGVLTDETTSFEYDALDRVIKATDALGNVSQMVYDAIGNKVQDIDALGRVTIYTYDAYRRLTRTDYPDGSFTSMTYDAEGNLLTETDANGNTTSHEYDALNRLIRTTHADGSTVQTSYDALSRVLAETDERGIVTTYEYDAAGQRLKTNNALGDETAFTYDLNGNLASMTDARGNTWQYAYDVYDNRTVTTWPDGTTSEEITDRLGRTTDKIDQNGNLMTFSYDALGRLLTVTDALNQVTAYGYDEVGNKLTQTDAEGRTTSWTYDSLGRERTRTLPLGQQESHQYDSAGNRTQTTDFNGQVTTYVYDELDRLTNVTYNDATTETFSYDNHGNRTGATDRSGDNQSWQYDSRHRLTQAVDAAGNAIDYQYDSAGNKTVQTTTPVGEAGIVTTYGYDVLNRLQSVTDANALVTTYSYDANGNRASLSYPNGNLTTFVYDANNRLTRQTTVDDEAGLLSDYQYTLDPSGHRLQIDEPSRSTIYSYDSSYKLLTEDITDPVNGDHRAVYEYDAVGNRTHSTINGVQTLYTYDENDRLLQQGGEVFTYDDNGNTLTKTIDGFPSTYAYDAKNHLQGAQLNDNGLITSTTYRYDVDGIRIGKTEGAESVGYLIDANRDYAQVLRETKDTGANINYLYGDDLIQQSQSAANERYFIYDGLGSTRLLADGTGAVTDRYDYEAFGSVIFQDGITDNKYLFTGEQYDEGLDHYYLRARYYIQSIGRFTQMDSWAGETPDPLSLHKYLYSGSDPVNHIDPSGHFFSLGEIGATESIRTMISSLQIDTGLSLLDLVINPINTDSNFAQNSTITLGLSVLGGVGGKVVGMLSNKWKSAPDIRFTPIDPGPLSIRVAKTFRSATYTQKVVKEPIFLYRVFGGRATVDGPYWTRVQPSGNLQTMIDSALLDSFGNPQLSIARIRVPEKQIIYEGIASPQSDDFQKLLGGGNQVYLPKVEDSWFF